MRKLSSIFAGTGKSLIICASLLALATSTSTAATATDVNQLFDEIIAFEQSELAQVDACNNAMVDITSGTFNQQALATAKEICITQAELKGYKLNFVSTPIGSRSVGFRRRKLPISTIRKAIDECNIDAISTQLTNVTESYRILYRVEVYVAGTRIEMIGKIFDKLQTNESVINPAKISDKEKGEIEQFLKATGLDNLSNDTSKAAQITHLVAQEYKAGASNSIGTYKLDYTYTTDGRKRYKSLAPEKDTWTIRITKPDCPPLKIVDRSPPPKEKLKRKPVTTYGGVRKPPSNGQNIVAERPNPAPKKPDDNPDITIQPINEQGPITIEPVQRFITEFDIGRNFPANDPTLGNTQKTSRDTGITGSLSVYVPLTGNGIWTVMPGLQVFGGRTDNNTLINPAPFPSSPFGGHTSYYGVAALLGLERRLGDNVSLRGFAGIGGASAHFEGFQNGVKVVSGTETVPVFKTGIAIFRNIADTNWEIGIGVDFTQLGSFNIVTNTGVNLKQGRTRDVAAGIYLRYKLNNQFASVGDTDAF